MTFFLIGITLICNAQKTDPEENFNCEILLIKEVQALQQEKECFLVEGYVSYIYECYCPPNAICKLCNPSILINSSLDSNEEDGNTGTIDLRILAKNSKQFEIGQHYTFSLKRVGKTFYAGTDKEFIRYTNQLVGYKLNKDE